MCTTHVARRPECGHVISWVSEQHEPAIYCADQQTIHESPEDVPRTAKCHLCDQEPPAERDEDDTVFNQEEHCGEDRHHAVSRPAGQRAGEVETHSEVAGGERGRIPALPDDEDELDDYNPRRYKKFYRDTLRSLRPREPLPPLDLVFRVAIPAEQSDRRSDFQSYDQKTSGTETTPSPEESLSELDSVAALDELDVGSISTENLLCSSENLLSPVEVSHDKRTTSALVHAAMDFLQESVTFNSPDVSSHAPIPTTDVEISHFEGHVRKREFKTCDDDDPPTKLTFVKDYFEPVDNPAALMVEVSAPRVQETQTEPEEIDVGWEDLENSTESFETGGEYGGGDNGEAATSNSGRDFYTCCKDAGREVGWGVKKCATAAMLAVGAVEMEIREGDWSAAAAGRKIGGLVEMGVARVAEGMEMMKAR